jgi:hypothetical protein
MVMDLQVPQKQGISCPAEKISVSVTEFSEDVSACFVSHHFC